MEVRLKTNSSNNAPSANKTIVAVSHHAMSVCDGKRFNPLSPAKTTFHAEFCNPVTRQAIELESCSNPLRIQQVL